MALKLPDRNKTILKL